MWSLLGPLAFSQQITLDTSVVSEIPNTIDEFWYWSWGFPVVGEGFAPNADVTVFATDPNGKPWRNFTGKTDANGKFSIHISAKKISSVLGDHIIKVTDSENNVVTATLKVILSARNTLKTTVTPNITTLADFSSNNLKIRSTNLTPNAEVKVHITAPYESSSEIEPTKPKYANEDGVFEMDFNLNTSSYPWGDSMPDTPGQWRVNINDFSSALTSYGEGVFRVNPNNPSTTNYCSIEQVRNATQSNKVTPITRFEIVGVKTKNSDPSTTTYYEDFTSTVFDLKAGETYKVRVKGVNGSTYTADTYTLFFDWNQNGILDEENEVIHEGYLFGSNGVDDKFGEFEFTVPANAVNGNTRLRVLKLESNTTYSMFWSSGSCGYYMANGQVEDYTVTITNGVTPPNCTLNCPEDITVNTTEGVDNAIVNYELGFDCAPIDGTCETVYPSNNFEFDLPNSQFTLIANDFDIPAGNPVKVKQFIPNFVKYSYGADLKLYKDKNGVPGDLITSFDNLTYSSQKEVGEQDGVKVYEVVIDLPNAIELDSGKYWVAINAQGPLISWEATSKVSTKTAHSSKDGGKTWESKDGYDGVFKVVYDCKQDPSKDTEIVLTAGLESGSKFPVGNTVVTHNLVYKGVVIDTCSFTVTVKDTTMEVNDFNKDKIAFFPNPVKDFLNISYDKIINKISIHDITGKNVYNKTIKAKNSKIDLTQLSSGVYLIKAEVDGDIKTFKIIKK
ncbi:GEVED domain-containing protein [Empedobacter tilapiae]|uniref:GEVED domain-containing protein n=1 Tax=Empedobacter tilapiae TaxID=2491114 RepID=UPI0028D82DF1|nr:GEVED domain-containing protein [Empedobacter tilapiae]